jgi:hypothetical protein
MKASWYCCFCVSVSLFALVLLGFFGSTVFGLIGSVPVA